MPTYNFRNNDTREITEVILKISELDTYKSENPHLTPIHISVPPTVRSDGNLKPDDGFRDVLRGIKKASSRRNNINTF